MVIRDVLDNPTTRLPIFVAVFYNDTPVATEIIENMEGLDNQSDKRESPFIKVDDVIRAIDKIGLAMVTTRL